MEISTSKYLWKLKEISVFFQPSSQQEAKTKSSKSYLSRTWRIERKIIFRDAVKVIDQRWMIELSTRFFKAAWRIYLQLARRLCEFSRAQHLQVKFYLKFKLWNYFKLLILPADTLMERNNLMSKCYPRIKDYCREKHGLEFQVSVWMCDKVIS